MPNYILFSILSAFFFSILTIIQKLALNKTIKNPLAFNFYLNVTCLIFSLIIWMVTPYKFSLTALDELIIASSLYFIGNLFLFYGMSKLDASVAGSLFPLKMIFVPVVAFIFLNEIFNQTIYIWIILATLGALLSTYTDKYKLKSFLNTGTFLILSSLAVFTFADAFSRKAIILMGSWNFQAWLLVVLAIESLALIPFIKKEVTINKSIIQSIIPISIFFFLGILMTNLAFEENITIPNVIVNVGRVPIILTMAIILSKYWPNLIEHNTRKVYLIRICGNIIIMFAVFQLILSL